MRVENLIPLGVIPGPHSPKSLDSFFGPFIQECLELAKGVRMYDSLSRQSFNLHVYVLTAFGDMPAMSKLLGLKGHNGYSPCRFCLIRGERNQSARSPYYVPLRSPNRTGQPPQDDGWDPRNLPERTITNLFEQLDEIQNASTAQARKNLSSFYGVNEKSRLFLLPSLSFPDSFPPDIMHLFFENICPMLRDHWTGTGRYKDKPPADSGYLLAPQVWEQIGQETADAYRTIPSEFVGAMPDISKSKYKAEYWSFWTIYFGPILLFNRFPNNRYYNHFCKLVAIIKACLQFTITLQELDELQENIISWVETYER
jgi:Transposase family tnp2